MSEFKIKGTQEPCPFCKAQPIMGKYESMYSLHCPNWINTKKKCFMDISTAAYKTQKEAINRWNVSMKKILEDK